MDGLPWLTVCEQRLESLQMHEALTMLIHSQEAEGEELAFTVLSPRADPSL